MFRLPCCGGGGPSGRALLHAASKGHAGAAAEVLAWVSQDPRLAIAHDFGEQAGRARSHWGQLWGQVGPGSAPLAAVCCSCGSTR